MDYTNMTRSTLILLQQQEANTEDRLNVLLSEHMAQDKANYYPCSQAWEAKYSDLIDAIADNRDALNQINFALTGGRN